MKKIFTLVILFIISTNAFATDYYWVGGTTTANIGAAGTLATSLGGTGNVSTVTLAGTDRVYFDGLDISSTVGSQTGTITFQTSASITVGQMIFQNNATVIYSCSSSGRNININGAFSGNDFVIGSGCSFTQQGSTNTVAIATSNTGSISGSLVLGAGSNSQSITAADASGLTINSGGSIQTNSNVAAFGNGTASSVVFASGSTYIHASSAANPFQLTAPSSVVVFQTGSLYKQTASVAPSFAGRTYADFEWNNTGSQSPTGGTAVTMDNLTMSAAGTLNINLTGGVNIKGNISVTSGTLTFTPASAANITFNGTTAQTITRNSGTLTFAANANVVIANTSNTVTFTTAQTISGTTTVNTGAILATSAALTTSGAVSVTGTLRLNQGGSVSATPTYNAGSTLSYNGTSSQNTTNNEFPATLSLPNLIISNSSGVVINTATTSRSITGTLTLTSGTLTNSTNNITLGSGATISRADGSLAAAPNFTSNNVNITYTGSTSDITTGNEMPASGTTTLKTLTINQASNSVILGANVDVNTGLALTAGVIVSNGNTITLKGSSSTITGSTSFGTAYTSYVATCNNSNTPSSTGGLVIESIGTSGRTGDVLFPIGPTKTSYNPVVVNNSSANVAFTARVNTTAISGITSTASVQRTWNVSPASGSPSAVLKMQWITGDEGGTFTRSGSKVVHYNGSIADVLSSATSASGSNPWNVSSGATSFTSYGEFGVTSGSAGTVTTISTSGISGLATSPITANATSQGLLGFSATTSTGTVDFTDLVVSAGSGNFNSFSQLRLVTWNGTAGVYGNGSKTVIATINSPSGSTATFTSFASTQTLTTSATYYYIEGDVASGVTGATTAVTPQFTNSNVTVSTGTVNGSATGSAYSFQAFAALDHFALSTVSDPQVAGTSFSVTITAQDIYNNTVTSFTSTAAMTANAGSVSPSTSNAFTAGVLTQNFSVTQAGASRTITATASGKTGTSNTFTVNAGALNNFLVEAAAGGAIGTQTAGTSFNIKVTARDANNNTVTGFTGTVDITSTGTLSAGNGTTASFTAGVLSSHAVTITNTGSFTITATRTGNSETGTSASFTVNPAVLNNFLVEAAGGGNIATQTAGSSFNIKVTARDQYNNTLSTGGNAFTGTVDISSTGTLSSGSGTTASFTAGVLSSHAVTISNTGSFTITATRTGNSETGTSNSFTVNAGALDHFAINTISSPQIAGTTFSATITAQDVNNNTVTSFTSTAAMTTNAGTISPSTSNAFTAGVLTQSFYVTQAGTSKTITATASGKTGTSNTFTLHPGAVNNFLVEEAGGGAIGTQVVNVGFNIQITARDQYNNTLSAGTNTFTGTVDISSTGTLSAGSGTTASFTAGVLSSHAVTISNTGSFTITATRTGNSETGTSNSFTVSGGAPTKLAITNTIGTQVAGTGFSVTVESQDAGGTPTPVIGDMTVDLSIASGTGSLIGTVSGVILDGTSSVVITNVKYNKAESGVSLSVIDNPATITAGTSNTFTVDPGAINNFLVEAAGGGAIGTQTAGTSFNIKVTARDQYNNTLSSGTNTFTGTVDITSTGTLSAGNGATASFTAGVLSSHAVTITNTGSFTITATRTGNSETGTSASFTVNPAVLNNFLVEAAGGGSIGTQTAGSSFNIKVTARDQYNNTLSTGGNAFTGTVDISSTGTLSSGSGTTASFTAGVLSSHAVTISNTGSFTITATRTGNSETGTSNSFTVNAGALDHFAINTISSPQIAGTAFSATITAQDVNNNTVTSFTSTAAMTTNAGSISPTTSNAFTAGVLTQNFTLTQAGSRTITATASGKSGTSNSFTVDPGALNNFLVEAAGGGNIGTQTAGSSFNIQVTARDANNNTLSTGTNTFTGTVDISSTGTLSAGSGTTASFTAGVLSSHAVTITSSGSRTITATRTGNSETGTSAAFTVNAAAASQLTISTISSQVAGAAFSVTVNSQDTYGNAANVTSNSNIDLTVATGTGSLSGGTTSGTILSGTNSIAISGVVYNTAESGVSLTATQSSGTPSLSAATSNTFTVSAAAPTVTTTAASSITGISASSGGNVTSDGGAAVTARGIVWSTSSNPTTSSNLGITSDGTGTGSFTSSLTGLLTGTTYHIRAYATNSTGTSYGNDVSFTTSSTINYYNVLNADITSTSNWGINTDGTGTNPPNFTNNGQLFNVTHNTGANMGGTLTVSGTGSKIIIGDGTTAATLTGNQAITATIDVANNGTLLLQTTTIPTYGTLSSGSTVEYGGTSITQSVTATSYSNLVLSGSGSRTFSGTTNISGTFTAVSGFTAAAGTIVLNGTGTQTLPTFTFNNLTISNSTVTTTTSGNPTVNGALAVNQNLTVSTSTTLTMGASSTITIASTKTLTVTGTLENKAATIPTITGSLVINGTYNINPTTPTNTQLSPTTNTTYGAASTLLISNVPDGAVGDALRVPSTNAGNVTWNTTTVTVNGGTAKYNFLGSNTNTITGKFTVSSTGARPIGNGTGGTGRTLTVGSMDMTGGEYYASLGTGTTVSTLTVSGDLNLSGGTLAAINTNTGFGSSTGANAVNLRGNITISGGTLEGKVGSNTGTGTMNINGTSAQTVSASGTYTIGTVSAANSHASGISLNSDITIGTLTVSSGLLTVSSTKTLTSSNAVSVSSGATLGGLGTVAANITGSGTVTANGNGSIGTLSVTGNVSFGSTGIYQVDLNNVTGSAGTINDLLAITGNLSVTSGAKINLSGTITGFDNTQTYTWTIATVSGTVTTLSNFTFTSSSLSTIQGTVNSSFSVSQVGNNIILTYNPVSPKIIWSASGNAGAWLTTGNWTGSVVPTSTDVAQFDANPSTSPYNVGINMNGATNNGTNNQAAAGIYVSSSRSNNLVIGNSSTSAGGTLTLTGSAISGNSNVAIYNTASSTATLTLQNTAGSGNQTMGVNLPATSTILTGGGSSTAIGNTINITSITSGAASGITFKGGGSGSTNGGLLRLGATNTFVNGITVGNSDGTQYGILQPDIVTAFSNTSGNNITINSNSQLYLSVTGTYTTGNIALNLNGNGNTVATTYGAGALRSTGSITPTWTGPINLASNSTIAADGTSTLTLSGVVSGSSRQLTKAGTGTLALTATNTFDGGVVVSAGTLQLNKTGGTTIPATSNVTINGGTLKVSSNQTINNVSIASGATLLVDAGAILTINGTYSCTSGTITNNGKIIINNAISFPGSTTIVSASFNDLETGANVTLDKDLTIAGSLTLTSGTLAVGSNTLTLGSTVSSAGGDISSSSSGTVNYSQTSNGQAVVAGTYGNLTFSNFDKTLASSGTIAIAGTFTPGSGTATVTGSTINFNGSAQNIPAFTYNNLTASGAATKTMTGSVTIGGALKLSAAGDKLSIGSNTLTLNGSIDGTGNGFITGSSSSNISIGGSGAFGSLMMDQSSTDVTNMLNSLTMNRSGQTATLGNAMRLSGVLTPTDGIIASGGNLTLASTASNTARIAERPSGGNGYITGDVTVERYITGSGNRAYRLLGTSVTTSTSINANWQEGKTNPDISTNMAAGKAGYGTHITGTAGHTAGFDETQFNSNSLYTYNTTGPTWDAVTSTLTGAAATMDAKTGYLLFVRGSRDNLNVLQTSSPSSNTTLRATGILAQGTQTFSSLPGAETHSLVTNPYASPIYWKTGAGGIYTGNNAINFGNFITIWDPNIGSRGGFVTIDTDGLTAGGTTNLSNQIQSGQAFFVQTQAGAGPYDFVLEESHKSTTNNLDVFRTGTQTEMLKTLLFYTNGTGRHSADGVTSLFRNGYSTTVDGNDAKQIDNWDEDVSISRDGQSLSIEKRPLADVNDTIQLKVARLKVQNYEWEFQPSNFNAPGMQAYLMDSYLGTTTAINLGSTTVVPFSVTSNPATSAANRFSIVFQPITITHWTGTSSTDFTNAANWDNGLPSITKNAVVPHVTNMPVLNTPQSINSITLDATADITLAANLSIKGDFVNNGNIKGAGTVLFNGARSQMITGKGSMNNLAINNTNGVSIETGATNMQEITGTLTLMNGVLNTNDNLTLKSTSIANTATVAAIDGTINKGIINGKVVVERFIPAGKRGFRFLAPGVTSTSTIKANWQEGATSDTDDPKPGYGTHITGSIIDQVNGFDATATGNPSLFLFDNATQLWSNGIANTDNTTLNAGNAYRLMVRGNRSYNLAGSQLPTNTATILRATGNLLTGQVRLKSNATGATVNMPLLAGNADEYSFVGNPYVAALDWSLINKTDITGYYYIWDPTLGTRGAYVSCFTDGTKSNASSAVTKDIQPGQAFFVQNNSTITTGPELTIEETYKSSGFTTVFRNESAPASINMQLFAAGNTNGISQDGTVALFSNSYSNAVNNDDATKMLNLDENIAITRGSRQISIERRAMPTLNDTVFIKLWQLANKDYVLKLDASNFNDPSMTAFLQDSYLNNETMLELEGITQVPFTANSAIAASVAPNRFRIVFRSAGALPVSITSIKAYQKNQGIQVDWATVQEINMQGYEVEKSIDGIQFKKAAAVNALGNAAMNSYNWFDANPVNGNNYYRIKSMEKSGKQQYSQVVKVNIGKAGISINAYPNPMVGNSFNLELNNLDKGTYTVLVTNKLGQELFRKSIEHTGGTATQAITIDRPLAIGTYQLTVVGKGTNLLIPLIKQ